MFFLPFHQRDTDILFQVCRTRYAIEVKVHDRTFLPIRFQIHYSQPLKQVTTPLKVVFQRTHEQALAEAAWTAKETDVSLNQLID